jgi:hypothetical protein
MRRTASFANTVVKGTLIKSDAGCSLAHMFRYLSNTHRIIGDFDASRNKLLIMDLSIVFAITGKYIFRMVLGEPLHEHHFETFSRPFHSGVAVDVLAVLVVHESVPDWRKY